MSGGPAKTDRWLVLAVLALAAAFLLSAVAWFAVGQEIFGLMVRAAVLEYLLKATPVAEEKVELVSRGVVPIRADLTKLGLELEVLATAYAPGDEGVDGVTASGLSVDRGVVAVDPGVIPFGSVVHVPGYGYALACDVGGVIRGRRIDVYFADRDRAVDWEVRKLTVRVYRSED